MGVAELIDALATRLPSGLQDLGDGLKAQAELSVYYEASTATWEVEFTPLDAERNACQSGPELRPLLERVLIEDINKTSVH